MPQARSIEITMIQTGESDELHRFYVENFSRIPKLTDLRLWQWEFLEHPMVSTCKPLFYLLKENHEIRGAIGGIPGKLSINNKIYEACHPVDFFVTENSKGLSALRLLRTLLSQKPILYASYVSDDAEKLFKAIGFLEFNNSIKHYYYGLNTPEEPLSLKKRARSLAVSVVRRLLIYKVMWKLRKSQTFHRSTKQFDQTLVPSESAQLEKQHIKILKSPELITWRYQKSPTLDCRFFSVSSENGAHCLLIVHEDHDRKKAIIMDLIKTANAETQLSQTLIDVINHYKSLYFTSISTTALNKTLETAMLELGFNVEPSTNRFMFFSKDMNLKESMSHPNMWEFNLGDTDVL